MKTVELPDGATATIITRKEVTVRASRAIARAKAKTTRVSLSLMDANYKPPQEWPALPGKPEWYEHGMEDFSASVDPVKEGDQIRKFEEVWAVREGFAKTNLAALSSISDDDQAALDSYETTLVLNMMASWSYKTPEGEPTPITIISIENLTEEVFEQLAALCQLEYAASEVEVEPSPDPLVTTGDSRNSD